MLASELKALETSYHSGIKKQDSKSEQKSPRKHKVPLTATGMLLGQQQDVCILGWLWVIGLFRAELSRAGKG